MTLQQLKEEAYREMQKFWLTNEPLPDFIDSLVDKAYEEGKKEGREEITLFANATANRNQNRLK